MTVPGNNMYGGYNTNAGGYTTTTNFFDQSRQAQQQQQRGGNNTNGGYSHQYGGGNAGGGGGFFAPSQGGNDEEGGKKTGGFMRSEKQSIRPILIKQFLEMPAPKNESPFTLDGVEVHHLSIVGVIRQIKDASTNILYHIEDGTGQMEVRSFISPEDSEAETIKRNTLREGMYVKVVGSVKAFQSQRNVTAYVIRRVEDHNELTYHMLDATAAHLEATRGPPSAAIMNDQYAPNLTRANNNTTANDPLQGATLRAQVLAMIQQMGGQSEDGVAVAYVKRQLCARDPRMEPEVDALVSSMIMEGLLYNTVDEEHVRAI